MILKFKDFLAEIRLKRIGIFWILPVSAAFLLIRSHIFLNYLIRHPDSFTIQSLIRLASHMTDLGFVLILFAGFISIGRIVSNRMNFFSEETPKFEQSLYFIAIGEALTAFLIFFVGLAGLFKLWIFWILFSILLCGAAFEIKNIDFSIQNLKNILNRKVALPYFIISAFIAAVLMKDAILTAAPPTDWDSLSYHLAIPKIFINAGEIFRIPWSVHTHFPLNTEMIYTLALALKSDLAAHWINFIHSLLFLSATAVLALRFFSKEAAWGSVLIVSVQPLFSRVSGNASTDFPLAFVSTLSILAFLKSEETENTNLEKKFLLLSGFMAGIAMSVKMNGVWLAASLTAFKFGSTLVKSGEANGPRKWIPLLYFILGAVVLGFPWYLKTYIWTGNPVWPYLGEFFGATEMDIASWQRTKLSITEGIDKNFFNYLLLPFKIVFQPERFLYHPHFLIAPFLTLLIFKYAAKEIFQPAAKRILWLIFIFCTMWFCIYQNWRYLLPIAGLFSILTAAWTVDFLVRRDVRRSAPPTVPEALRRVRKGFLRFVSLISLFSLIPAKDLVIRNEGYVFLGLTPKMVTDILPRDRYLESELGAYYKICKAANEILPHNAKILLFRDVRGYYLDRDYAWGDPLNPGTFSYSKITDSAHLHHTLKSLGFTHILHNPHIGAYKGDQEYYRRSNALMDELLQKNCKPILSLGGITLFEIR